MDAAHCAHDDCARVRCVGPGFARPRTDLCPPATGSTSTSTSTSTLAAHQPAYWLEQRSNEHVDFCLVRRRGGDDDALHLVCCIQAKNLGAKVCCDDDAADAAWSASLRAPRRLYYHQAAERPVEPSAGRQRPARAAAAARARAAESRCRRRAGRRATTRRREGACCTRGVISVDERARASENTLHVERIFSRTYNNGLLCAQKLAEQTAPAAGGLRDVRREFRPVHCSFPTRSPLLMMRQALLQSCGAHGRRRQRAVRHELALRSTSRCASGAWRRGTC